MHIYIYTYRYICIYATSQDALRRGEHHVRLWHDHPEVGALALIRKSSGFSVQAVAWSQSGRLFELSQCGLLMFLAKAEGAG